MNTNIEYIVSACENIKIPYSFVSESDQLMIVDNKFYFSGFITPFNTHIFSKICKDKEYSYLLLHDLVKMPKTIEYLDPSCEYKECVKFNSYSAIVDDIIKNFSFPLILKKNSGSRGVNVFECNSKEEVKNNLKIIFDKNSKNYDYIALAEEKINSLKEFRVIVVNDEVELVYEKDFVDNEFNFNAIVVFDENIISNIREIIKVIANKIELNWVGLDIILDKNNSFWVIEMNSAPSFEEIKGEDKKKIVKLFENAIGSIVGNPSLLKDKFIFKS